MRSISASILIGTLLVTALSGCVVDDIHDQLVVTNDHLVDVEADLQHLKQTNEKLDALTVRLQTLDSINSSLQSIDSSLKNIQHSLTSIDTSLDGASGSLEKLDAHLASLRETISNIDETIPFLEFSNKAEQQPGAPAPETSEGADSETSSQAEAPDDASPE